MSCQSCIPISCIYDLDDVDLYSLQGDPFLWVTNCPPGYSCNPDPRGGTISLKCCGEVISKSYPANATNAQYQSILASVISDCAARQAFCGEIPPPIDKTGGNTTIFYWNRPQQCMVRCGDNSPFFYTVPAGRFLADSQRNADNAAFLAACRLARSHIMCLSDLVNVWCEGSAFDKNITASNANYPNNFWQVALGSLPPGLTFAGGFGGNIMPLTGTPTTPGDYSFTIQITNPLGDTMAKTYSMCIVGQTATPAGSDAVHLPNALPNVPYTVTLSAPTCAIPPLSWQLKLGDSLPAGLALNETTGVISGTPTVGGTYTFTIILQTEAT